MKQLYTEWGDRLQFVDVLVRQGHPGPDVPPYRTFEEKARDAERYKHDEQIPWTVLVDDLEGTVHRQYGMIADPAYLIGTDGRVAFYNYWTHVPTLHKAVQQLIAEGGAAAIGEHRTVHPLATITDGCLPCGVGCRRVSSISRPPCLVRRADPGSATRCARFSRLWR